MKVSSVPSPWHTTAQSTSMFYKELLALKENWMAHIICKQQSLRLGDGYMYSVFIM